MSWAGGIFVQKYPACLGVVSSKCNILDFAMSLNVIQRMNDILYTFVFVGGFRIKQEIGEIVERGPSS